MVEASRVAPEQDLMQEMGRFMQPLEEGAPVARLRRRDARTRQESLRLLVRAGLLQEGGPEEPLVVDRQVLAELIQELRAVAEQDEQDPTTTRVSPMAPTGSWLNGPKLIAVNGPLEGTIFALDGRRSSWVLGRGREAEIALSSDPYVSRQSAEVWREEDDYFIEDLQHSKNGTYLNWRRLDRREAANLQDGDIITVGRSLLVFRSA